MTKNDIVKKEITSDIMLEEIIAKDIQIPGVKVDRNKFLAENFSYKVDMLEEIIKANPELLSWIDINTKKEY